MTESDRPRTIHFVLLKALAIPLPGTSPHGWRELDLERIEQTPQAPR